MSYDVPLIGFEGRSTLSFPDLLGVFRAAQKQGPITLRRQIYFNSWILSGMFYNTDVNAQIEMRKSPKAVERAYFLMQYATDPANFPDLENMGISEQRDTLTRGKRLISLFQRRLSGSPFTIEKNILTLGHTGHLFNIQVDHQRDTLIKQKSGDTPPVATNPFLVATPPFVPAHFAAHMMNLIGERLRENKETENLSFMYRVFLPEVQGAVPLGTMPIHSAGEESAAAAVSVLRAINMRLQEVLKTKDNESYLPKSAVAERRLAEELFMFTKPYREHIPKPAPATAEEAAVISMDDWREKISRRRTHTPSPS